MVCAILEGRKKQTRRIEERVLQNNCITVRKPTRTRTGLEVHVLNAPSYEELCSFGQPGDRLWVKETHCYYNEGHTLVVAYQADNWSESPAQDGKWKPSIFCTRAASRITLEVTAVRVERLNDISKADAIEEGLETRFDGDADEVVFKMANGDWTNDPVFAFRSLWESINGPGSWDKNPWVWVVEFKRVESTK